MDIQISGIPSLPQWGTDTPCNSVCLHPGGSCANTARHLASLVSELPFTVSFFSACGGDQFGKYFIRHLTSEGLLHKPSETIEILADTPQSVCAVLVGAHDRAMISCYSSNSCIDVRNVAVAANTSQPWTMFHIGGYFSCQGLHTAALLALCKLLRVGGTLLSLDLQYDASEKWIGESGNLLKLLPLIDIFLPSENEAIGVASSVRNQSLSDIGGEGTHREHLLVDAALNELCTQYPKLLVVIKCGSDGVRAGLGVSRWEQHAFDVELVDATGCGDAFDAGFLSCLLIRGANLGSLAPHVPDALREGCAAGACCARTPGACVTPIRPDDLNDIKQRSKLN